VVPAQPDDEAQETKERDLKVSVDQSESKTRNGSVINNKSPNKARVEVASEVEDDRNSVE
jgi:phage-related protein